MHVFIITANSAQTPKRQPGQLKKNSIDKPLSIKSTANYNYGVTPSDLQLEQQAFEAGENVSSLVICVILHIFSRF